MIFSILCSNCSRKDVDFYCYECIRIEKALSQAHNIDKNLQHSNKDAVLTVLHSCFQSSLFCSICKELHGKIKSTKMHNGHSLLPSIVPCSNCEETESKIICLDCIDLVLLEKLPQQINLEGDKNFDSHMHYLSTISFCDNCYSLHRKVKSCRDHSNKLPMKFAGLLQASLGHICPKMSSESRSLTHHFFDLIENFMGIFLANVNITSFVQRDWLSVLWGMFEQLYDDMMESSYSDVRYWRSVVIMTAVCLLFNLICKGILGSATGGVAVVIILGILYASRYRHKARSTYNDDSSGGSSSSSSGGSSRSGGSGGSNSNSSSNSSSNRYNSNTRVYEQSSAFASNSIRPPLNKNLNIDVSDTVFIAPSTTGHTTASLEEEDFPGEFWYPLESKQAHFKPRGRPYGGRVKKRGKDAVSPKEKNTDL